MGDGGFCARGGELILVFCDPFPFLFTFVGLVLLLVVFSLCF